PKQQLIPQAGDPGFPRENRRSFPTAKPGLPVAPVEGVPQGTRGSLICSYYGKTAGKSVGDLEGKLF
ncbi:MAG TPA: hypothetical protein VFS41_03500, partial [Edaphobacter sp.]|nr:hypothetical protein [Edaphobacter sp.]